MIQRLLPRPSPRLCAYRAFSSRSLGHVHVARSSSHQKGGDIGGLVVVVGAGAAGLTAAYFAAKAGAKVVVLERTKEAGKKILMSGGSRCNVLPMHVDLQRDFFTDSSRTSLKAVFASWSLSRCKEWLEGEIGLELGEEAETSKYFPISNSSREVRDKLIEACRKQGVEFRFNASLEGLHALGADALQVSDTDKCSVSSKSNRLGDSSCSKSTTAGRAHGSSNALSNSTHGSIDSSQDDSRVCNLGSGHVSSNFDLQGRSNYGGGSSSSSSMGHPELSDCSSSARKSNSVGAGKNSSSSSAGWSRWLCRLGGEGGELEASKLIICTGGFSFPTVGTDGTGHRLLQGLGQELVPTYPALTPLIGTHPANHQLAGLSMYQVEAWAEASAPQGSAQPIAKKRLLKSPRNSLLFTHKGYSGPAILDLSHIAITALQRNEEMPSLRVNWTQETSAVWEQRLKAGGMAFVSTVLQRSGIRERLAAAICEELQLQGRKMSELKKTERAALVLMLTAYELKCAGHEGYKKAEVTGGGVPLSQMNCSTMESKLLPGIHLAGEICDVFGRIGGFNFYWAWVSGRLAGLGAVKRSTGHSQDKAQKREDKA